MSDFELAKLEPLFVLIDRFTMVIRCLLTVAVVLVVMAMIHAALAQTPLGAPPAGIQSNEAIEGQAEGNFPPLPVPSPFQGGLIRESWAANDLGAGVEQIRDCGLCPHHVRLGVGTGVTLILPIDEEIQRNESGEPLVDIGRPDRVFAAQRGTRMLYVTAQDNWGVESSLQVYTKSGRVFVFRLQAENVNSATPPHLAFEVVSTTLQDGYYEAEAPENLSDMPEITVPLTSAVEETDLPEMALPTQITPPRADDDSDAFMVDITKTYGHRDFEVWGSEEGLKFKPELIFRDDKFTYLQFDEATWKQRPYMSAFVTLEGKDQVINSLPYGQTVRIDHVAELITLKFGTSYLCIKYVGDV